MSIYSIPTFIMTALIFLLGIFTYIRDRKSVVNKNFFLMSLSIFIWLLFTSIAYNFNDKSNAEFFLRLAYVGIVSVPLAAFDFVLAFLNISSYRKFVYTMHAVWILLVVLILKSDFIIDGVYVYFWGHYPKAGLLHPLLLFFTALLVILLIAFLINHYLKEKISLVRRFQIRYVIVACFILTLSSVDFVANYGIEIYPFGWILVGSYLGIVAYAILKHHLMDIEIVIKKGLVYSVLAAIITAGYLIFVISVSRLFQGLVGYQSFAVNLLAVFSIGLVFNPLRDKIQHFLDKKFFKGTLESLSEEKQLFEKEIERSERLKAVATFASGMAHKIKNPLTAIKTFAEHLPEKKSDPEFLNKFSKIVGIEVERIDSLVHQLLNFAKPKPLKLQVVDVHVVLNETLNFLSNELVKHKINLVKEYSATHFNIQADSNQLKQAFLNIFLNAIDAMPDEGMLTVSTSNSDINSQFTVISIKDTGCGIQKKDLPRIFEPFYSKKEQCTGLGLSIVYNIIKEHSGNIRLESKVGVGTKLIIELLVRAYES